MAKVTVIHGEASGNKMKISIKSFVNEPTRVKFYNWAEIHQTLLHIIVFPCGRAFH